MDEKEYDLEQLREFLISNNNELENEDSVIAAIFGNSQLLHLP